MPYVPRTISTGADSPGTAREPSLCGTLVWKKDEQETSRREAAARRGPTPLGNGGGGGVARFSWSSGYAFQGRKSWIGSKIRTSVSSRWNSSMLSIMYTFFHGDAT